MSMRAYFPIPGVEEWEHLALVDLVAATGDLLSTVSPLP